MSMEIHTTGLEEGSSTLVVLASISAFDWVQSQQDIAGSRSRLGSGANFL